MNSNQLINRVVSYLLRMLMNKGSSYLAQRGQNDQGGQKRSRTAGQGSGRQGLGQGQQTADLRKKLQNLSKLTRRF